MALLSDRVVDPLIDRSDAMAPGCRRHGTPSCGLIDRSDAMASGCRLPPCRRGAPSCGLIDICCYIAYRPNSTTAWSKTSTGRPIAVSFCAARPPALSQISVHCPGLGLDAKALPAWVICSDADLVVLRVPLDLLGRVDQTCCDYFVYRTDPQHAKLDLLPNPCPARLGDDDIGILSRGDGRYVVAGLRNLPGKGCQHTFVLHQYRSTDDGARNPLAGRWTSQRLSVEEPLRDRVCPIPDRAEISMYHTTNKVIVLGGDKGLVGWVDLWRGILLCDVLAKTPTLRDIPLPAPSEGNRTKFMNYCPNFSRSIAVNQRGDTIKYVEMQITLPRKVPIGCRPDTISFYEWVHTHHRDEQPMQYTLFPGGWKATTFSMAIPVVSWDGWRRKCSLHSVDLKLPDPASNPRQCKLLNRLMSRKEQQGEVMSSTMSMKYVSMAYPALSTKDDDGDVVYLLSKGRTGREAVSAVDMRKGAVQGVAMLDTRRHARFQHCFFATGISKHIKTTGKTASFRQAKDEDHMHRFFDEKDQEIDPGM